MEFLAREQADILLLQEVFSDSDATLEPRFRSFEALQADLSLPYGHFAPTFIEPLPEGDRVQGNAILSRFPLKEVSVSFYDMPFSRRIDERSQYQFAPRNLQHVTAQVGDKTLHLLNTQGIWGEDGGDTERRLQMSECILREVGENNPLVLGGDFNVQPNTQTMQSIAVKLTDVFANELKTTFAVELKDLEKYPGYATAVVDMVFVTADVRVTNHYCPKVAISDHLPLVVEVEV